MFQPVPASDSLIRNLLHFRYKPGRSQFKDCGECPVFDHFDWVVWKPDAKRFLRFRKILPRRVLCLAHKTSLEVLIKCRFLLWNVDLVVAGEDTRLSELRHLIDKLVPHCRKILFEAKDIPHPHAKSFCMGFISYYLLRLGETGLSQQIEDLRNGRTRKQGVLAAWGAIWKNLDDELSERKQAAEFVEASSWLQREELDPAAYVNRLATSRYLIAPAGAGVQAPKLAEAWLLRTVPIVIRNPCFEDLHAAGYPLLILDRWTDLTPTLLDAHAETLAGIDWEKIGEMLTLRHFVRHILGSIQ